MSVPTRVVGCFFGFMFVVIFSVAQEIEFPPTKCDAGWVEIAENVWEQHCETSNVSFFGYGIAGKQWFIEKFRKELDEQLTRDQPDPELIRILQQRIEVETENVAILTKAEDQKFIQEKYVCVHLLYATAWTWTTGAMSEADIDLVTNNPPPGGDCKENQYVDAYATAVDNPYYDCEDDMMDSCYCLDIWDVRAGCQGTSSCYASAFASIVWASNFNSESGCNL